MPPDHLMDVGMEVEHPATVLEGFLKRDRIVVMAGICLVVASSWTYILQGAGMGNSDGGMMATPAVWTVEYAMLMFIMWWVMMVAMMLPSATPMILLFAIASRSHARNGARSVPASVLAFGYLLTWGLFSVGAVALQWVLTSARLLSPMMESSSMVLGGGLLVSAGIYQLTPLKDACLRNCRSPLSMVLGRWRPGVQGAFLMGCEHGAFCLGCCWVLMGLLFYGGVMNMAWIGGLAAYVLVEKMMPMGVRIGRYTGGGLIIWGSTLLWLAFAA